MMMTGEPGRFASAAVRPGFRSASAMRAPSTYTLPAVSMVITSVFCGAASALEVRGRFTLISERIRRGVAIMKMIRRTSTTSVNGVMLIPSKSSRRRCRYVRILPCHQVDDLRSGELHVGHESLDASGEVVKQHDRGHRYRQARGRGDQRLGDAADHHVHAARTGKGDVVKRADDAQHGPEQAHVHGNVADGAHDAREPLQ